MTVSIASAVFNRLKVNVKSIGASVSAAAFALVIVSATLWGQDWSAPYTDQLTLGGALEPRFTGLLSNCNALPLHKVTTNWRGAPKEGPVLSSIPYSVQTNFGLKQPILSAINRSTGQIFSYVYRQTETVGSPGIDQSRLISDTNYIQDPASMLLQGGSSKLYVSSCGSIISAAASLNAEWSVPIASAKAALSSDYSNSVKSSIAVTQGNFHSPIYALWSSADATQNLFAGFLFWEWYVNHPEEVNNSNYYLTDFQGASLYGLATTQTTGDISLSASGGLASPFVSLNASIQDKLNQQTSLSITDNYTYVYAPANPATPWGHFLPLPTPTKIAQVAQSTNTQKTDLTATSISKGQPFEYTQVAYGVPNAFCTQGQWSTDYSSSNGRLSIEAAIPGTDKPSGEPICSFKILFGPDDSLFAPLATAQVIPLSYDLRLRNRVAGLSLQIPAAPLMLSTSVSPVLVPVANNSPRWKVNSEVPVPGTNAHDYSLGWSIQYHVIDTGDPVSGVDPYASLTMTCPGVAGVTFAQPIATPQYDSGQKVVTISLASNLFNVPSTINADDLSTFVNCTVNGSLNFQMATPPGAGRVIPKAIGGGLVLEFPSAKPQPPAPTTQPPLTPQSPSTTQPAPTTPTGPG